MRLLFWLLAVSLLSLMLVPFSSANNDNAVKEKVILVFGDSLSAGFGVPQNADWVTLLQQKLQRQKFPYRIINASISGETTLGGLNRLPRALQVHRPQLVIIELGGNDGLRGLPLKEMEQNLSTMITLARQSGAKVLLAGMRLPPNYGQAYTRTFYDIYARLAQRHNCAYLPFLLDGIGAKLELMQEDGIHPKADAQGIIVDNVWTVLAPLLN